MSLCIRRSSCFSLSGALLITMSQKCKQWSQEIREAAVQCAGGEGATRRFPPL